MKYKAGDKARVKGNLEANREYGGVPLTTTMAMTLKGEKVEIAKISNSGRGYYLVEDKNKFIWTDEMLEPLHPIDLLEPGDIVQIRRGDKYLFLSTTLALMNLDGYSGLEFKHDAKLRGAGAGNSYDIMCIYRPKIKFINIIKEYKENEKDIVWKCTERTEEDCRAVDAYSYLIKYCKEIKASKCSNVCALNGICDNFEFCPEEWPEIKED